MVAREARDSSSWQPYTGIHLSIHADFVVGAGISGGLCKCILQYSVGCGCLSVLGILAFGSKVLMYHVYIINIYSCTSIIVWECILICMCMVTLLSMWFCVFICVYMYSCMCLLNCIFIDCLYYWSLLTMHYCFLWICSADFGIKQLELQLEMPLCSL